MIKISTKQKMERNYAEDQANEVEALESIYCDDIEGKLHISSIFTLGVDPNNLIHSISSLFFYIIEK